ncbi:hypothetical protein Tsubulata_025155 [Turnera subulata]|uniref:Uncharacterized protein n=1 Tax=Turnera subulata TaxID=218843 RepID=A0A9Q0FDI9_9ROSI|nr:hypothetical protein Tsubulata_025155 [Turnera subulata]
MVELQSCASLVNDSALGAIEQQVKEESAAAAANPTAEILAELQREREKNAALMERISVLEAQIQEMIKRSFLTHTQDSCLYTKERSLEKFKRQKTEDTQSGKADNVEILPEAKDNLVNWMSMDEEQVLHIDRMLKDDDSAAECDAATDDSNEEEDPEEANSKMNHDYRETKEYVAADMQIVGCHMDCQKHEEIQTNNNGDKKSEGCSVLNQPCHTGNGSISMLRKSPKLAFCPKEVKRILASEGLSLRNAQSHTIRKIIVFASLGIRHGCDDIHELDFNHFRILRKGEPYVSPKEPGEHVLYEIPGTRRKIFYPNRKNPTLCPVRILEEEKAMRPSDPGCPSCLFLCIKYGGRTRNLPQNEYVRQRMGRNKLKSFGPLMCRMAMLVHIRTGSFFFKALGITLLFMAGFPDNLVQRETKYRNLDLLQKYYRTDEDAAGEELFRPVPKICDTKTSPGSGKVPEKKPSTKSKGRKRANSIPQPQSVPISSCVYNSRPLSSFGPSTQFGLMGYNSIQTHPMPALQSMPSQATIDTQPVPNQLPGISYSYPNQFQAPFHMFPPQQTAANNFVPMMYWSAPHHGLPPTPYASIYNYRSFPSTANYISIQPRAHREIQPSCSSLVPKLAENKENSERNDLTFDEADIDSDGSSTSSTEPKQALS